MKKIYCWDIFRFEVSIDHNKIWFMHLGNCLNKIYIFNKYRNEIWYIKLIPWRDFIM